MSDSSECEFHEASSSDSELIEQLVVPSAEQEELKDILATAETCTANENLRIQNSRQTKALKQVEVVKMNYKNSGNKHAHPRKPTNKNNRTKNNRIEHVVQRLNLLTADFDGQFILFSACPNNQVWSSSIRAFGPLSKDFLESRVGHCLTNQWHHLIDSQQEKRRAASTGAGPTEAGSNGAGPTEAGSNGAGPTEAGSNGAGPIEAGSNGAGPTEAGSNGDGPTEAGSNGAGPTEAGPTVAESTVDGSTEGFINSPRENPTASPILAPESHEAHSNSLPPSSWTIGGRVSNISPISSTSNQNNATSKPRSTEDGSTETALLPPRENPTAIPISALKRHEVHSSSHLPSSSTINRQVSNVCQSRDPSRTESTKTESTASAIIPPRKSPKPTLIPAPKRHKGNSSSIPASSRTSYGQVSNIISPTSSTSNQEHSTSRPGSIEAGSTKAGSTEAGSIEAGPTEAAILPYKENPRASSIPAPKRPEAHSSSLPLSTRTINEQASNITKTSSQTYTTSRAGSTRAAITPHRENPTAIPAPKRHKAHCSSIPASSATSSGQASYINPTLSSYCQNHDTSSANTSPAILSPPISPAFLSLSIPPAAPPNRNSRY